MARKHTLITKNKSQAFKLGIYRHGGVHTKQKQRKNLDQDMMAKGSSIA